MFVSTGGGRSRLPLFLVLGFIFFVTVVVYFPSLTHDFIFDDRGLTVENDLVTAPAVASLLTGYRPLRTMSYALDHFLWGPDPAGFRAMNIFYHLCMLSLLWLLFRRLSSSPFAAIIALSFYALHPVNTEAVAYISGRRDILTSLFFIAALLCLVTAVERRRLRWLALSFLCALLSFSAKEMGAMIPVVAFLYFLVYGTCERSRLLRWGAVGMIATFLFGLLAVRGGGSALIHGLRPAFHGGDPLVHYLTAPTLFTYYLKQSFFPLQLVLDNANYPLVTSVNMKFVASLLGVGLFITIAAILFRKGYRPASFFIVFFLVTLLPVLQIVPLHEIAADHYLYLPLVGVAGLIGEFAAPFESGAIVAIFSASRRAMAFALFGALVAVLFAAKAMDRVSEMRDIHTVLIADSRWRPVSFRGLYTMGALYLEAGFPDRAFRYYRRAWDTGFRDASLYGNLINYHIVKGDHRAALLLHGEFGARSVLSLSASAHVSLLYLIAGDCGKARAVAASVPEAVATRFAKKMAARCDDLRRDRFPDGPAWADALAVSGIGVELRPIWEAMIGDAAIPVARRAALSEHLQRMLLRFDVPAANLRFSEHLRILSEVPGSDVDHWHREAALARETEDRVGALPDPI